MQTFVKVCDLKNITKAADEMHISQPSVSEHIKALERELGVTLFKRTARGMEITPHGEKMEAAAREVLSAADTMIHTARELDNGGKHQIRISTNTYPEVLKINDLLMMSAEGKLNIDFAISHRNSRQILTDIRNGVIDCGFAFGKSGFRELDRLHLASVPMRIIGPESWKDRIDSMGLDELSELPWVFLYEDCPFYEAVQEILKGNRSPLKIATRVDHEDQILSLVTSGLGISVIPECTLEVPDKRRNLHVFSDMGIRVDLSFFYRKSRENDPAILMLKRELADLWKRERAKWNSPITEK